jgi:uncharacterized membrane protein YfcA
MTGTRALLTGISLLTVWYIWCWVSIERARARTEESASPRLPRIGDVAIGFGTLFFDTLGVGAFAPTIAIFKILHRVPDEEIPGTLNAGQALPGVAEALIFIAVVAVDLTTLTSMIVAAGLGSVFGVRIVARLPRRALQLSMGTALLVAAALFLAKNLQWMPAGGDALALHGGVLVFAVGVSFILGALMMLGIGFYAPCLILLSLLGMNPLAAFPIMMGANIFPMLIGGAGFIRTRRYDYRTAVGLTLGGIPGVLIAAYVVKSLPIVWLRWLVLVVVLYAATAMLNSARRACISEATLGCEQLRQANAQRRKARAPP